MTSKRINKPKLSVNDKKEIKLKATYHITQYLMGDKDPKDLYTYYDLMDKIRK